MTRSALSLPAVLLALALAAAAASSKPVVATGAPREPLVNPRIDDEAFVRLTVEATAARAGRRLSESEFAALAARPGVVVLDARSRRFYDLLHVQGALSLPFPELTAETLRHAIPDADTPVLIYCNNNFTGAELELATKAPPAALNLSTFVALWTYGYRNVYELGPLLDIRATTLPLAGANAVSYRRAAPEAS